MRETFAFYVTKLVASSPSSSFFEVVLDDCRVP